MIYLDFHKAVEALTGSPYFIPPLEAERLLASVLSDGQKRKLNA